MSAARGLPARPSLDSLRKQAKRLGRDAAAGNGEAIARVHAQLPHTTLPLSNRDAQLIVAREYGFVGWSALTAEVRKRVGGGPTRRAPPGGAALPWPVSCAHLTLYVHLPGGVVTLVTIDMPCLRPIGRWSGYVRMSSSH